MPITACDLLYERVLPFYESIGVSVGAVLTDNGREFCGKPESHPYEILLGLEEIEHRTTKVRSPRTNGFVERMNHTLLDLRRRFFCFAVDTWRGDPQTAFYDFVLSEASSTAWQNAQYYTYQALPATWARDALL